MPKAKACGFGSGGVVSTDHENAARIDGFASRSCMRTHVRGASRSAADGLFDFLTRSVMHMQPRNRATSAIDAQHGIFRLHGLWHLRRSVLAIAMPASLALMAGPVAAQVVTSAGDVLPSFAEAASVDLAGQRVFIGLTNGSVGTLGTLSVTGGGSLTAAQIVPGTGGLGVGVVNVDGPGSIINLTGGAAFNGLDIGSWGTGTMTVSNGA
jgi:hypothetical protein